MIRAARAVAVFLSIFFASTSASGVVTKMVGSERFCVPESRFVNIEVPYIPEHLPDDGFVFELPVDFLKSQFQFVPGLDIRGRETPLTGSVSTRSVNKLSADSHPRRVAASSTSIVEPVGNQFLGVFETKERKNWVIWKPTKGAPMTRSSINDSATLVASCSVLQMGAKSCRRVVAQEKFSVGYYFDYANVKHLDDLDNTVLREVRKWRCPHGA